MISKEEIKKLADLARIHIEEREQEKLAGEIDAILGYVKLVYQFHSDNTSELGQKEKTENDSLRNIMREDENPTESGTHSKELLAEMPKTEKGYLKVKKIL